MAEPILQSRLPFLPWMDARTARLPGVLRVPPGEGWLMVDDAFAGQMAMRDHLIATNPAAVLAMMPEARPAAEELLAMMLEVLGTTPDYARDGTHVTRPDGVTVAVDPADPMRTLGRLVQEDLCILQSGGAEHLLTAAALCFPASWTLAQKIGRTLLGIHHPVPSYSDEIGRRVQRMFDAIRPDQPLWRMNFLTYDDPVLHQPRAEGVGRPRPTDHVYVRCERQTFVRLPKTRAVVFAIHTFVVHAQTLTEAERAALDAAVH